MSYSVLRDPDTLNIRKVVTSERTKLISYTRMLVMFRGQGLISSMCKFRAMGGPEAEIQCRGQEVHLSKTAHQSCPRQERKEECVVGTKFCICRVRIHKLHSVEEGEQ